MGGVTYGGVLLEGGAEEGGGGGDWYALPGVTVDGPVADEPMIDPLSTPGADESPAEDVSAWLDEPEADRYAASSTPQTGQVTAVDSTAAPQLPQAGAAGDEPVDWGSLVDIPALFLEDGGRLMLRAPCMGSVAMIYTNAGASARSRRPRDSRPALTTLFMAGLVPARGVRRFPAT